MDFLFYVAYVCFYFMFIYLLIVYLFLEISKKKIVTDLAFCMPLLLSYFFLNMFLWYVASVCGYFDNL
jgi:hypothetical protein